MGNSSPQGAPTDYPMAAAGQTYEVGTNLSGEARCFVYGREWISLTTHHKTGGEMGCKLNLAARYFHRR